MSKGKNDNNIYLFQDENILQAIINTFKNVTQCLIVAHQNVTQFRDGILILNHIHIFIPGAHGKFDMLTDERIDKWMKTHKPMFQAYTGVTKGKSLLILKNLIHCTCKYNFTVRKAEFCLNNNKKLRQGYQLGSLVDYW